MSSLRKLAADLGVSHSTVSAALRGLPGVKSSTRERVRSFAATSGYRLNPLASAVMGELRRSRGGIFRGVLAVLRLEPRALSAAETERAQRRAAAGISGRAAELGFRTEEITLGQKGYAPAKLAEILAYRGVDGVLVFAPEDDGRMRLVQWNGLNAVVIGAAATEHGLSSVCIDHLDAMTRALGMLRAAGFQRPGLVLRASESAESRRRWEAAFRVAWAVAADGAFGVMGGAAPRPFVLESDHGEEFRRRVEEEQLDAVLSGADRRSRYPIPHFSLDLPAGPSAEAGIDQGQERFGVRAVDLLAEQVMRNREVSRESSLTLLPARWRWGGAEAG
jgi:DNA-binding LacI/PurR family transcriptional regulator